MLHIHPAMEAPVTKVHLWGSKGGCAGAVHAQRRSLQVRYMQALLPRRVGAALRSHWSRSDGDAGD